MSDAVIITLIICIKYKPQSAKRQITMSKLSRHMETKVILEENPFLKMQIIKGRFVFQIPFHDNMSKLRNVMLLYVFSN